jgi:hypothetical protein
MTLNYRDEYHIHYEVIDKTVFMAISDSEYPKRLVYAFLLDMREKYDHSSAGFEHVMRDLIDKYNSDNIDNIAIARRNV